MQIFYPRDVKLYGAIGLCLSVRQSKVGVYPVIETAWDRADIWLRGFCGTLSQTRSRNGLHHESMVPDRLYGQRLCL